jgi:hypothetical protein
MACTCGSSTRPMRLKVWHAAGRNAGVGRHRVCTAAAASATGCAGHVRGRARARLPCASLAAVKEALKPSSQAKVSRMVAAAQGFAARYLSQRSRALFYEKAVTLYNDLFGPGYMEVRAAQPSRSPHARISPHVSSLLMPSSAASWASRQGHALCMP